MSSLKPDPGSFVARFSAALQIWTQHTNTQRGLEAFYPPSHPATVISQIYTTLIFSLLSREAGAEVYIISSLSADSSTFGLKVKAQQPSLNSLQLLPALTLLVCDWQRWFVPLRPCPDWYYHASLVISFKYVHMSKYTHSLFSLQQLWSLKLSRLHHRSDIWSLVHGLKEKKERKLVCLSSSILFPFTMH